MSDFRTNLWNTKTIAEIEKDSIEAAAKAAKDSIEGVKPEKEENKKNIFKRIIGGTQKAKSSKGEKASKKEKKSKSAGAPAKSARVSVRRTRR